MDEAEKGCTGSLEQVADEGGEMIIDSLEKMQLLSRAPGYLRLFEFCEQIESGGTPDQQILEDLAKSFRKMLKAKNTEKALSGFAADFELTRKGRPPTETAAGRNWSRAVFVHYYQLTSTLDEPSAIKKVAAYTGCVERTVRRALNAYPKAESFARYMIALEKKKELKHRT